MHRTAIVGIGLALAATLPTTSAISATGIEYSSHTYVSPTGVDGSGCSLTSPCATFQAALALTTAGGEISVLGTADYGPVTITQAVSIVNGGGFEAGIMVPSGGTGITINAGASDAVSLRGLTIEGAGVGQTGIRFNTGKSLIVESCVIDHLAVDGIEFFPNATSSLSVSNSLVADNGSDGIYVAPNGSGTVTAVFNHVETNNNSLGIGVYGNSSTGTTEATISESLSAGNGSIGIYGVQATLIVSHSVISYNSIGLEAGTGAKVALGRSTVTGNQVGWVAQGGALGSYGDNYINGNVGGQGAPTIIGVK